MDVAAAKWKEGHWHEISRGTDPSVGNALVPERSQTRRKYIHHLLLTLTNSAFCHTVHLFMSFVRFPMHTAIISLNVVMETSYGFFEYRGIRIDLRPWFSSVLEQMLTLTSTRFCSPKVNNKIQNFNICRHDLATNLQITTHAPCLLPS